MAKSQGEALRTKVIAQNPAQHRIIADQQNLWSLPHSTTCPNQETCQRITWRQPYGATPEKRGQASAVLHANNFQKFTKKINWKAALFHSGFGEVDFAG
jgi:hypothetical protein